MSSYGYNPSIGQENNMLALLRNGNIRSAFPQSTAQQSVFGNYGGGSQYPSQQSQDWTNTDPRWRAIMQLASMFQQAATQPQSQIQSQNPYGWQSQQTYQPQQQLTTGATSTAPTNGASVTKTGEVLQSLASVASVVAPWFLSRCMTGVTGVGWFDVADRTIANRSVMPLMVATALGVGQWGWNRWNQTTGAGTGTGTGTPQTATHQLSLPPTYPNQGGHYGEQSWVTNNPGLSLPPETAQPPPFNNALSSTPFGAPSIFDQFGISTQSNTGGGLTVPSMPANSTGPPLKGILKR